MVLCYYRQYCKQRVSTGCKRLEIQNIVIKGENVRVSFYRKDFSRLKHIESFQSFLSQNHVFVFKCTRFANPPISDQHLTRIYENFRFQWEKFVFFLIWLATFSFFFKFKEIKLKIGLNQCPSF